MRALVTGIGGQDGSYLGELLLAKGYDVVGTVLGSPDDHATLASIRDRVRFVELTLEDLDAVAEAVAELEPDELYHLAAASYVPAWWDDPVGLTRRTTAETVAVLEGVRRARPATRQFHASSSEIFAGSDVQPQSETTRPVPLTPYGAAKAFGLYAVDGFRRRYGAHASSGILFNHESPRRAEHFVTRKIARAAAAISLGLEEQLTLGNLDARRDWGFAGDYVRAMWLMLQQEEPDDYVVATGEARSVRDFAEAAFAAVGLRWADHVRHDEGLERGATDARALVGDSSKARLRFGWRPEVGFEELVRLMVESDLTRLREQARV